MENNDDVIVMPCDIIPAGYCVAGAIVFAKHHNLNWKHFLRNGIPASQLLALNDSLADALIEQATIRIRGAKIG